MQKKTIIVSQDDKLRHALEFLLNTEPRALIAASIRDRAGLLALAKTILPDLVFLDWDVPDQRDAEVIKALHHINPKTKTIVLSHPKTEQAAHSAGADVCIIKGSSPEIILKTFRALA